MPIYPSTVFITGANRGIGLEFVKQLLGSKNPPNKLIASCRKPAEAKELNELSSVNPAVHVLQFDVTDFDAIPKIVSDTERILDGVGLNLLINNAGIIHRSPLGGVTLDEMRTEADINCIAPVLIAQAFVPLLRKAAEASDVPNMSCDKAAIVNITSKVGSIADNRGGGRYAYRASKAGLNAITKSLSIDLAKENILAVVLHPGWVQTSMGGPDALIDTVTCVQGLLNVMATLDAQKSGTFWDYKGEQIPW
ncbi:hypothetical protein CAPTEDRAFT_115991 [Capitella teleta]|uniref:C-factor n=1 Tax=Capitella teleta TaxID=283909 RepID=R7UJJ2_CAPTE|nr:hypothetical protein CAPTEDRAFT_115991 [Capitella teleta]|eukprot:ELU06283.1 hypothetical protein CAPTEDRAFT_115991 [Capitella teleta]